MLFLEYLKILNIYKKIVIITTLIFTIIFLFITYLLNNYKVYYFFSIDRANILQSDDFKYNNYYATQYSDQFTESIKGWFSNPSFIVDVLGNYNSRYFSVRKVERQNILVTFNENDKNKAQEIANKLKSVLNTYLSNHNKNANTDFILVNDNFYIKENSKLIYLVSFILSIVIGLILSIFIISIIAYQKKIYLLDDSILSLKNTEILRLNNKEDYTWLNGKWKTMIISGINIDISEKIIDIAYVLSNKYKVCVINLDFAESSKLADLFGIKANIQGISDIMIKSDIEKFIFQDKKKKFFIIDKGQKDLFDLNIFIQNVNFDKIIINLPMSQNYVILRDILKNTQIDRYICFVQRGISDLISLKNISNLYNIEIITIDES